MSLAHALKTETDGRGCWDLANGGDEMLVCMHHSIALHCSCIASHVVQCRVRYCSCIVGMYVYST